MKKLFVILFALMLSLSMAAGVLADEAADEAAALIDAIYVQTRTADTDAQCAAAKAAWDALTPEQQAMVEGENAGGH